MLKLFTLSRIETLHHSWSIFLLNKPGRLWRPDGCEDGQWSVGPGWHHLMGYRLRQEEPAGGDDEDSLLQGLDQHHHQVLSLYSLYR